MANPLTNLGAPESPGTVIWFVDEVKFVVDEVTAFSIPLSSIMPPSLLGNLTVHVFQLVEVARSC